MPVQSDAPLVRQYGLGARMNIMSEVVKRSGL